MANKILDFIDFTKVNTLLERFNQSTGFVTAILDLEGNILSKSGWRQICTEFHRINAETSKKCVVSDTVLAGKLGKGEKFHAYKCLNGMYDVAVPIIVKGEHIANLFSGQFFFEEPDKNFFKEQAKTYGFNETAYLKALQEVPVISEEKVKIIMEFLLNMTLLISDMTLQKMELVQLNETLRASEERYRMLFDCIPDGVVVANQKWDYLDVNQKYCQMLGYTRNELIGINASKIVMPEELSRLGPSLVNEISKESTYLNEWKFKRKDGSTFIGEAFATRTPDGSMLGIVRDITERKKVDLLIKEKTDEIEAQNEEYSQINEELNQTNEELYLSKVRAEESEMQLRTMFSVLNAGIALIDIKGNILEFNNTFVSYLGYTPKEIKTLNTKEITHPDDIQETLQNISQIVNNQTDSFRIEKRFLRKDKTILWVDISGSALKKDNEVYAIMGLIYDITDRKKIEFQLQSQFNELVRAKEASVESEINLQTVLSSTNDIIASYDLNICLLTYNKACSDIYRNLFGIEIYPGLCTLDLFPESLREFWRYHNSRAIAGETFSIEINIPTANGELIFEQYYNPIFKEGKVVCFSTFTRDITEKKRIEIELLTAKEHAEESDRLKTAFLQNMSHEIRTPMNAIMGFSDLLLKNADNKTKLKSYTDIISKRCNDLLDIINDILDISKIESGQLPINLEETNLNELFAELNSFFKEYQNRISKQHILFSSQVIYSQDHNLVVTDKVKLKQIFINLISNAFKFTDTGKIEYGCKFDSDSNLLFFVSDTGFGIPTDKHQFIFERFTQLHDNLKKNIGGTGLGLPIVKALVGLLGGQVFLESEPGKGSTFSFTIPYKPAKVTSHKTLPEETINEANFNGKTVLIVEDDPYNVEYQKEILSGIGLNLLIAENGIQAVQISLTQNVDIVLMDIRLPDISGYEAIRQIKLQKPQLKIIAQTAYAALDEKHKAIEAGCVDYVSKPTKQEVLLSILNKHLKQ